MSDIEKREEPNGTTLTLEEWIELMNKHDPLEQYAKKRKRERREKRKEEQAENDDEKD